MNKMYRILPYLFLLHNAEEAVFIKHSPVKTWFESDEIASFLATGFSIAVILFTVLAFAVCEIARKTRHYDYIMTAFAGMLFLNVFFPHLTSAVVLGCYTPGVATAVFIILPATSHILWSNYRKVIFSKRQFGISIISGAVFGFFASGMFLLIGKFIAKCI